MKFYNASVEDTLKAVKSTNTGLTDAEAKIRLEQNGKNAIIGAKKKSLLVKLLSQFADPMIIVLLVAAVVSAVFAIVEEAYADLIDSGIILLIVIINAVIGLVQENKAENALEALKDKNKPFAKVIRGGEQKLIPSEEVVVGDIVVLEAGDVVPADLRLISSASLKIEEAALTGESVPVEKDAEIIAKQDAALGDRVNCAFSGGTVTYGRGLGVVTATGMNTEMGKIADMLAKTEESPSPLSKQLATTAKILSVLVLAIAAVILAVTLIRDGLDNFTTAFMTSVAIAVAAIPEGLPAVVTIVLAMGVQKMSKQNAIVKNLPAVETLGCCEIICSDKTGTLTLNKMTVKEAYSPSNSQDLLKKIMALCNDTAETEAGLAGDPTETALVDYYILNGESFASLKEANPRINELPFDSVRKLMTTVHNTQNGAYAYTKGAPDMLLTRCDRILTENGVEPLTDEWKQEIITANSNMANKALRVLAAAYLEGDSLAEENMIFVGLMGMIDPPRPEVKAAVAKCRTAGMKALMITGDHLDTAKAIARELDIMRDGDLAATGKQLDEMTDEYLNENILKYSVFARVSPENKVRIVKAFRSQNKVVAMTGDGVNDAPSIKEADIGIGMGITGTQVSKEASDMVLTDDNFATIVGAVEEGRKIYSNITKAIQFLLSANIAEVLCLFIASIFLGVEFLTPVMILWINLITDSFPALSLGTEAAEKDVMNQPPRKSSGSLFGGALGKDILIQGIMQTLLVLLSFCLGHYVFEDHAAGMTMAFVSLSFIQLFHSYNLRSQRHSVLNGKIFGNKFLNLSALAGILLTLLVVLVPFFNTIFHTVALSWYEWLISVGVALAIIPLVEIQKLIEKGLKK
ncbi:MAG: calcium-translocating P-type ATPase, PMCA-type [Clostridiales bacterium]|nr:calcium-translocating P-type ATPase, PMCA-type [Clostridiales bacterium]